MGVVPDCGSAMLDKIFEMQEMGIHIDTRCQGFAYSMAFILFIVGERRNGGRFSKYMNHGSSASAYGMVDKMKADINFFAQCDEQFDNLILKQTDMPKERLEMAKLKNDWIFYDEAIELGIVNSGFDGAEADEEEFAEKLYKAFDLAIATFQKVAEVDEQNAMAIMHDILDGMKVELDEDGNPIEKEKEVPEEELVAKAEQILESIEECKKENECGECEFREECKADEDWAREILDNELLNLLEEDEVEELEDEDDLEE